MISPHRTATVLMKKGTDEQAGWRVETKAFTCDAIEQDDGTVTCYVTWGDAEEDDILSFGDWFEVRNYLRPLVK